MNQDGPELRDIHLPADPSWWPPAPGWWLLGVLILIAIIWLLRFRRRRMRQRYWMASVRHELGKIAATHAAQPNAARLAGEISALMRRASLLIAPHAAALQGEAWLQFLDAQLDDDSFTHGVGRVLVDAPFQRTPEIDADALLALSARWLDRALAQRSRHV